MQLYFVKQMGIRIICIGRQRQVGGKLAYTIGLYSKNNNMLDYPGMHWSALVIPFYTSWVYWEVQWGGGLNPLRQLSNLSLRYHRIHLSAVSETH